MFQRSSLHAAAHELALCDGLRRQSAQLWERNCMRGLKDKVAIVTGAAGRIGKSVVRRLVEEEARVVAADINVDAAQALVAEFGSQAIAIGFDRSEEHTSELQSLMRISYAVFCLKKKTKPHKNTRLNIED